MRRALLYNRTQYRAAVMALNPVGYWRLGEASGTVARDEMGAHDGTYVGSPTLGVAGMLAGDPNTAVMFPTSAQYLTVADAPALRLTSAWTVAVRVRSTEAAISFLFSKHVEATSGYEAHLNADGSITFLVHHGAPDWSNVVSTVAVNDGAGHIVVCRFDNGAMSIFVDGASAGTSTAAVTSVPTNTTVLHWAVRDVIAYPLTGTLDEPAIWNRALTANEIARLCAVGRGF